MPSAKPMPGSASDWLRHAKSDLALAAGAVLDGVLYNQLCFHAQQAAEKSIKAVLIHYGIEFQKVHDLASLMALLPPKVTLPPEAKEVRRVDRLCSDAQVSRGL